MLLADWCQRRYRQDRFHKANVSDVKTIELTIQKQFLSITLTLKNIL